MNSTSKSSSIRDIENKYGINLTTCKRYQLDALTSKNNANRIRGLSDLMINTHQFDIDNMTEAERENLKYLVMSTDEVLNVLKKKSRSLYHKPKYARLRWTMTCDDFQQVCASRLLLNDNILKFNADYNFECAIYFWLQRVALWKNCKKANTADEYTILDKPCGDDNDTTIGDLMLKDSVDDIEYGKNVDADFRVDHILSLMDKTASSRISLKAGKTSMPYSEYNLAKLFIVHHLGKKELSKMMYNTVTNKLVSNQIFNKFYKQTLMHIAELLSKEAHEVGETFSINEDEL